MAESIKHITIVGGGTAGWFTANMLSVFFGMRKDHPANRMRITLIESPNIPTVGVGEATVPSMSLSLQQTGISETDFFKTCNASFKLGVDFAGWNVDASELDVGTRSPRLQGDGRLPPQSLEHEIVAGAGETAELQLRIGRAYSLRFRDAEGRVGPATLASAIADPDLCAWWLCAVPRSVGHAAVQAAVSLVRALAAGERRLRCDVLLPGLNPRIETACGLDDRLLQLLSFELARCLASAGRSVMLLFDSAGTAASAQAAWVQLYAVPPPASVVFRGLANKPVTRDEARGLNWDFSPAVTPNEPRDAYVVVRPRNSRGDAVVLALMQAHAKMPDATWLLINPELEDTALRGTFGIRETDRYMSFLGSFEQCYLARGMYLVKRPRMTVSERGHLGMRYGESWDALKRNANGFSPIERFARRPTPNEIDAVGW